MSNAAHFVLIQFIFFLGIIGQLRCVSDFQPIYNRDALLRPTRATEMRKYMNQSADPCDDFYEYACGNWMRYLGRSTKDNETPAQQLLTSIDNELRNLLGKKASLEDSVLVHKAKDFYKSCLSAERNGQEQQQFLSEFIKSNGGFPAVPGDNWQIHHHNYEWLEIVAQLRKNYGMDILVGLRIDINFGNVHENSIYLTEPSTLLPSEYCSAEGTKRVDIREREYELIERDVATNLKYWLALGNNEAKRVAAEIVTFEFELCEGMRRDGALESTLPADELPMHLQANYERKNLLQFTQQFNDQLKLNDYMSNSFDTKIYMPVYMAAPQYFEHLIKTVGNFNKTTLANYIMYRAISLLTLPLDDQPSRRPTFCLNVLKRYFHQALSEMYERQHVSESIKSDIQVLYNNVKQAFEQSLHSTWLEDGTSRVGSRKLHDIVLNLIEHERTQASNIEIDSNNYWHNLVTVMGQDQTYELNRIFDSSPPRPRDEIKAYETRIQYRPVHKRIDMAWGLLQPPYYNAQYGNSIHYAALGQQLAMQLALAFNDVHWAIDIHERNSWDPLTAAEYRNRSKCFATQLGNYLYDDPAGFTNVTELRVLIARSAGLNVAFRAYLNWLHFQSPNNDFGLLIKETLPELNFSNTQLYFLTFAQLQCHVHEHWNAAMPIYSVRQRHTLARYAVNGPLRNSAEFAREFSCKAGSAMNPDDKCVIY